VRLIQVAGGIVWRETASGPRLAVIHRPRRGDWSLPKGRLDPGEGFQEAARREILEETGCEVRLGRFAGAKLQVDRPDPKLVLYWHARVVRMGEPDGVEVDEVAWLSRREALSRLDHDSDRRLLLRALGDLRGHGVGSPFEVMSWPRLEPTVLRSLLFVDSQRADDAIAAAIDLVSGAVARGGRRLQRRRA
jgi:ADP-ribose pyrophosphatase YjhB (NUDIX family)